ncbi:methylmalonyl-CoA mutase small subunit [Carboxylicivirga sp. M1479]|uniref:methylmalonyl-CoA mutase small subunit n=1 Tax=Carboxylicivirga sp. M1479 TaxID=2594476 RepID=UPI0011789872|nr:methylmalonyl-CoA mutase small subunit [Carboxylicivirga sp. M1479]TRX72376.1 methylmalonyl-CoA mutase small subunit [Carboxylicivirga sp. M1479]
MADKTNQLLFSDFPKVSTQEWMDKITADLKGADFEKKLVWRTNEGFNVQPFYRSEDLESINYLESQPGDFPYVRGNNAKTNKWFVRQDIVVKDVKAANEKALTVLTKGVDSIGFVIEDKALISEANIEALLKNIISDDVEINFNARCGNKQLAEAVVAVLNKMNRTHAEVKGSIDFDPIGSLTIKGSACCSTDKAFDRAKEIAEIAKNFPQFRTVAVNAKHYNNAGASIVQELAFGLSMGNEYLSQLTERGLSVNEAAGNIKFNFGISGNYFMEIAKLRAGRLLWAKIVEAYKPTGVEVCKLHAHSETSEWNKTIFDPNVNMLRTQTEAMSATLGGTQSLTVQPYDALYKESDDISERIARNQQLLLKEESHFEKIVDPAAGSYYIENLTHSVAEQAWALFVEVEEKGGYLSAMKEGFIQGHVKATADKRRKAVATRRENLLGTNQFPNTGEIISGDIDLSRLNKVEVSCEGENEVEPITLFRAADEFETLRLATEKAAKRPKVFMLTYGNLAMRLARSQFSGNFFGCAGYEIQDNLGFETIEAGVEAAKAANADIVVLCSADDEYTEAAPKAFELLGDTPLVIAGAPACADELKAKGIKHFVNVRSNVLETLQGFNEMILEK